MATNRISLRVEVNKKKALQEGAINTARELTTREMELLEMAKEIIAVNPPEVKNKHIEVAGRQYTVTRLTERCWLLTDDVTLVTLQFPNTKALWAHVDRLRAPAFRVLDLPQLPARAQSLQQREDRTLRRNRVEFFSKHPKRYPTRGVIALPATLNPEPKPEALQHTPAQAKAIADFLNEAEAYFNLFSQAVNGSMKEFNLQRGQWKLRNAELAAGQAANKYVTYYSMEI
jgi:hypothetical protein